MRPVVTWKNEADGPISLSPGESVTLEADAGDFTLKITVDCPRRVPMVLRQEGVRKPGRLGETFADSLKPDSRFAII